MRPSFSYKVQVLSAIKSLGEEGAPPPSLSSSNKAMKQFDSVGDWHYSMSPSRDKSEQ